MIYSVVFAILGLIIFLNSDMTNKTAGLLIGIFFLFDGILYLYMFLQRKDISFWKINVFYGVLSIILGIFIMFNPLAMINFLNILLGLWLFVEGISKFMYFYRFRKIEESSYRVVLVSSISMVLLGLIAMFNPFRAIIITKTVGMVIVLYNVLNLNDLVLFKKRCSKFMKGLK